MAFFSVRSSDEMGWTLVAASSLACSFGASIVFLDQCTDRFPALKGFSIEGSPHFLAASLSLASGVMLFSALFNLLPEAVADLRKANPGFRDHAPQVTMALYFSGVAFTLLVNLGVRLLTPGVSCPCEPIETGGVIPVGERDGARRGHDHDHDHDHGHGHGHGQGTCGAVNRFETTEQEDGERSRLLRAKASRAAAEEAKETARLVREAHAATATAQSPLPPVIGHGSAPDGTNGNGDNQEIVKDTTATFPVLQRRSSTVTVHCQGLYEDHAFLHHHTHATTTPRIDTAEPSHSSRDQSSPPVVAQKYGTFSPTESFGKAPSKPTSPHAPSVLPHLHHQSHHHHPHHHHYPYQNISYNCGSNTSLDMHHAQQQQQPQPLKSPIRGTLDETLHQNETPHGQQTNEQNYFSPRPASAGPASHISSSSYHDHHRIHMHDCDSSSNASSDCSIKSSTNICHEAEKKDRHELLRIGVQTAVAISLHKFPEGLITFVGAKASPAMGFSVFLAIFIHNIPEGLMIAVPLLVATSSRLKAFVLASLLGGLSQPLGALFGYFLLPSRPLSDHSPSPAHEHPNDDPHVNMIYGTLFAFVAGLMTCVVVQGMFPAAVRFDPKGKIVTTGFFAGVALVGGSWAVLGKSE